MHYEWQLTLCDEIITRFFIFYSFILLIFLKNISRKHFVPVISGIQHFQWKIRVEMLANSGTNEDVIYFRSFSFASVLPSLFPIHMLSILRCVALLSMCVNPVCKSCDERNLPFILLIQWLSSQEQCKERVSHNCLLPYIWNDLCWVFPWKDYKNVDGKVKLHVNTSC